MQPSKMCFLLLKHRLQRPCRERIRLPIGARLPAEPPPVAETYAALGLDDCRLDPAE